MKKISILIISGIFLLTACGPRDKQSQLQRLERERDALNEQIEQLKAELAQSGSGQPKMREQPMYVSVSDVKPEVFQHFIKVQGIVESDNNIMIPSQASGIVQKIFVDEGDKVTRGQLLAELDGAIYESNIAEVENALDLANTIYERRKRLWENTTYMQQELEGLGFDTNLSASPVIPLVVGEDMDAYSITVKLQEEGVFVNPVVSPAVPPGHAMIRTSYMATHTREQLDFALEAFAKVGREMGLIP